MLLDEFIEKLKLIRTQIDGNSKVRREDDDEFPNVVIVEITSLYSKTKKEKCGTLGFFRNGTNDDPITLDRFIEICENILNENKEKITLKLFEKEVSDVYYISTTKLNGEKEVSDVFVSCGEN